MGLKITTQVEWEPFLKLLFQRTYQTGAMRYLIVMGLGMLLASIYWIWEFSELPFMSLFGAGMILFGLPVLQYFQIKKQFADNKRIRERIIYELEPRQFTITGESFYSTLTWEKVYQVEELNDWFLIYENAMVFNMLSKKSFQPEQIIEFRNLLRNVPQLKLKLKG